MPDFMQLGLPINLGIFAAAAVFVWQAGTRITRYADAISERTGLGHALLGLLLLGGVTSLPELAVTVSAAQADNAALAVNNLLGGVSMQIAVLAIADVLIGRRALTAVVPDPVVMLQGALCVILLGIVAAGILVGDYALGGIGLWSWGVLGFTLFSLWKLSRSEGRRPWIANPEAVVPRDRQQEGTAQAGARGGWSALVGKTVLAAAVILVAGFLLSRTGEAIAEQTGLGSSFVGAVMVAIATSLPEISTTMSAVRLGFYTMAISDILGTNILNVGMVFITDAVASGEAVLDRVGDFSLFGALLGMVATSMFVAGLAERHDRTVLRMGVDSAAVIVVYLGGVVVLYSLRGGA